MGGGGLKERMFRRARLRGGGRAGGRAVLHSAPGCRACGLAAFRRHRCTFNSKGFPSAQIAPVGTAAPRAASAQAACWLVGPHTASTDTDTDTCVPCACACVRTCVRSASGVRTSHTCTRLSREAVTTDTCGSAGPGRAGEGARGRGRSGGAEAAPGRHAVGEQGLAWAEDKRVGPGQAWRWVRFRWAELLEELGAGGQVIHSAVGARVRGCRACCGRPKLHGPPRHSRLASPNPPHPPPSAPFSLQ